MRRLKCILLAALIMLTSATVINADNSYSADDIDISDLIYDYTNEEISLKMPSVSDMQLVGKNENMALYFYPSGMDIYLISKTGKIWSNVINDDYFHQDNPTASISSQLVTVNAADEKGETKEYILYDGSNRDISGTYTIENNQLILIVKIEEIGLSLKIIFGIENDSLYYQIPDKEIKEGKGKIVSISLLQNFGATRNDENGYVFYPDGSGAITRFNRYHNTAGVFNQLAIYGNNDLTYVQLERNWEDNIYGALLPIYGISQTEHGFLAVIDEGAADAKINLAMPGYQVPKVFRTFFSYNYRSYSSTEFNKTAISSLVDERTEVDRKCYYYFFSGENNNYSYMANRYRKYLTEKKVLSPRNNDTSMSLNFICGVEKNGMFSSTLQKMTTFDQIQKITNDFLESGVEKLDLRLTGWGEGGWDTLPTLIKAESKLGGKQGLKKLQKYCDSVGIDTSLDVETILANSETGSFNARKNAVRNYFGDFFIDKTKSKYILNAANVLDEMYSSYSKNYNNSRLNLLTVGKIAFPDYNSKNVCTTEEIIKSYTSLMEKAKNDGTKVSCTTGNGYVLPYVDMIYELPQNSSGYTFTTETVPFYQMVVHGYIPYTGTVGNTHYDIEKCILEWAETGSIPSFMLTYEGTDKLKETDYNSLFSSKYSSWKEKVIETYNKFTDNFGFLQNETIISHEKLENGVVKVKYANDSIVYINYNETPIAIDNHKIEAKNYLIIGGK